MKLMPAYAVYVKGLSQSVFFNTGRMDVLGEICPAHLVLPPKRAVFRLDSDTHSGKNASYPLEGC
jgi:hypothetical protein